MKNRRPLKTKTEILEAITELGERLAQNANPQSWSHENRSRAKAFEPKLKALRKAYSDIKAGNEALPALVRCRSIFRTGIELNFLNLIIHFIKEGQK